MGSLFDLLRGEVVDIVDYAVDHHKRTGRPPTLAVNADSWWYANLSRKQLQEIRDRSGVHVNPIESNILFYALRILHLGIQLHFVFDGPLVLHNGGISHPGYDPPTPLLRDVLTKLAIPWHQSPGEAEAECAKMEVEGLVDGVWSEDGDAFAYGCKTLIRSYREIKLSTEKEVENKSSSHFQMYTLPEVAAKQYGMNQAGFVLKALLTGGDSGGIPDFEPRDVLKAARDGLGKSLSAMSGSQLEFQKWVNTNLSSFLTDTHKDVKILKDFPTYEQLQDYIKPVVSTREQLLSVTLVPETWDNEEEIFTFLSNNFQWTIKRWAKWIVPLRVVRSLLATKVGEESQHDHLKLRCDLKKKSKKVKATFVLAGTTSLDLSALRQETFNIETLTWILRRARLNGFAAITSYFTPPQSERASSVRNGIAAPSSSSVIDPPAHSRTAAGEGSSQKPPLRVRQFTPPSPSPAQRGRSIASKMGAKTTKNIAPSTPDEKINVAGKGKGKANDVPLPPKPSQKRVRSSAHEAEPPIKKAKGPIIDLTSSSASSDSAESILLQPHPDDLQPYSEEDYGSAPSSQDLQAIPINFGAAKSIIVLDDTDSEDEYGSFPSTPDIKELL